MWVSALILSDYINHHAKNGDVLFCINPAILLTK